MLSVGGGWTFFIETTNRKALLSHSALVAQIVPDDQLRTALEDEMPRLPLSCFDAIVSLPDAWDAGPCAYLLLSGEPYGESAADARGRGWPVVEIPGAEHLAMAEPIAVTNAILELERALVESA